MTSSPICRVSDGLHARLSGGRARVGESHFDLQAACGLWVDGKGRFVGGGDCVDDRQAEAVAIALGGAIATAIYATTKGWAIVIPTTAWAGGFGAALLIGAIAGLLPAIRAARLSPTEALRSV
jgi:hypothetical protein